MHQSITLDRVLEAAEYEPSTGFCCACGSEDRCVPATASEWVCKYCDKRQVYGAAELLACMTPGTDYSAIEEINSLY